MFSLGKGAKYISGYSLMSKEKKDLYDEKKLTKYMSYLLYFVIALVLVSYVAYHQGININIFAIIFFIIILVCVMNVIIIKISKKK